MSPNVSDPFNSPVSTVPNPSESAQIGYISSVFTQADPLSAQPTTELALSPEFVPSAVDSTSVELTSADLALSASAQTVLAAATHITPLLLTSKNQTSDASEYFYDELSSYDSLNPTRANAYKDDYLLTPPTAGTLQIDLESWDFDAYLQLIDADTGRVLLENDDFGSDTDAQLSFNVAANSRYIVRATSYYAFELGDYSLTAYLTSDDSNPNPGQPSFDSTYGYGLVNAAAAVAKAINQNPFADVADRGGLEWNNDLVKAPEVWAQGFTGRGITVAVIDSGVDINHQELRDNIWTNAGEVVGDGIDNDNNGYIDDIFGWNFGVGQNNNDVRPGTNNVGQDHGTHVAGTIAAKNDGTGMTGVAYDAQIMAIRMGDVDNGSFTNGGNLAQAIRYAVDNGADVINMSLTWPDSPELADAMAYAASKNVITVTAAGNNSQPSPGTPGYYSTDYGITVGAVDRNSTIANFSNRAGDNSAMQYVVAPGVDIYSTIPGGSYGNQSGTSMAAPHVAGVVALMLSANRNLTHAQVRDILTSTSLGAGGQTNPGELPQDGYSSAFAASSGRDHTAAPARLPSFLGTGLGNGSSVWLVESNESVVAAAAKASPALVASHSLGGDLGSAIALSSPDLPQPADTTETDTLTAYTRASWEDVLVFPQADWSAPLVTELAFA